MDIRDQLTKILGVVTEHQRFAEAKNVALLAANAAAVIGILQVLSGSGSVAPMLRIYLGTAAVFCAVSGAVGLLSFIPQTHVPWLRARRGPGPRDNLLFFGDIQKYDVSSFLVLLCSTSSSPDSAPTMLDRMYAEQIIVNARIASRKFTYFRVAIWIAVAGLLTPLLAALLYPVIRDSHRE